MKKWIHVTALAAAVVSAMGSTRLASAQIPQVVVCPLCANAANQLTQLAQLVEQVARAAQMIALLNEQLADMKQNSSAWSAGVIQFQDVDRLITQMQQVAQVGQAASYTLGDPRPRFDHLYPGWEDWPYPSHYLEFRHMSSGALDMSRGLMSATNLQSKQLQDDTRLLQNFRAQVRGSNGRQKSLQTLAQFADYNVTQLVRLREQMLVQSSMQAHRDAYDVQREVMAEREQRRFFKYKPAPRGYGPIQN